MVNLGLSVSKLNVPLKIGIFMLFIHHKVLLTKCNLAKPNWHGHKGCYFCDKEESIHHPFVISRCSSTCCQYQNVAAPYNFGMNITV